MAIYHFSVKTVSCSAVAVRLLESCCRYRAGASITDQRTGEILMTTPARAGCSSRPSLCPQMLLHGQTIERHCECRRAVREAQKLDRRP